MAAYLQTAGTALPAFAGAVRGGPALHPRAACSTTWRSTTRSRWPWRRPTAPYLWDVDGNRYIDFLQAGGPTLLGNNYAPVRDKVIELLRECGPVTGLFHEYELKLAQLINRHMPAVEIFRMLGSGTEACMAAIRAARTFTGKSKIIKVGGAYHGWSDQLVYGLHIPGTGAMEAFGIPGGALRDTQEFYPDDLDPRTGLRALLEKNASRGGTAAVILEPVGPESGTRPIDRDFNRRARALCDEFGALLIFDEVVTGFRMGLGGAQGYFGVRPDLTVFGKCVAGGYPAAGGLGGRREVMATPGGRARGGQGPGLRGRHAVGQPAELRGRLPRPAGDGGHRRRRQGRPGRRPAARGAGPADRAARPALRRLQPGLDRAPGDRRAPCCWTSPTPTPWARPSSAST